MFRDKGSAQDSFEQALQHEQIKILYQGTPLSLIGALLIALLLSSATAAHIPEFVTEAGIWMALMLVVSMGRMVLWLKWRTLAHQDALHIVWLTRYRIGTWLAGATWGAASFFLFQPGNYTQEALLSFAIAGITSGAIFALSVDKFSALGFVVLAVLPLTFQIFFQDASTALAMSSMSILFILFVGASTIRAQNNLQDQISQRQQMALWQKELEAQQQLGKVIAKVQANFIGDQEQQRNSKIAFDQILVDVLTLTHSQIGLIGEVVYHNDKPLITNYTICRAEVANDDIDTAQQATTELQGSAFKPLIAELLEDKIVILRQQLPDPDQENTGKPAIEYLLGLPIFSHKTLVAVIILARKEQSYIPAHAETLQPLLAAIAQLIEAGQHFKQHLDDETALQESFQHTQAILDEVVDAIITINNHGKILSFNHAAEIIFGYLEPDIAGKNIEALIAPTSKSNYEDFFAQRQIRSNAGIISSSKELTGLRHDNREFAIEIALSEISRSGKPVYVCVVRDINDRKRIEQMKNDFISTVSHELRTPLTSITGALGLLSNGSMGRMPEGVDNMIRIAHKNSLRLHDLINDLLDMDKLLAGKMQFQLQPYSIMDLIDTAVDSASAYAEKYQIKINILDRLKNAVVLVDVNRLQQVLNNLLSNAIKFSPAGKSVNIKVQWQKSKIRVSVIDQGEGIPDSFKANIFQKFSQADSSSTRKQEGTGLGLAISKELIEQMGGTIGFDSTLGKGTCFYFELNATKFDTGNL